MSEAVARHARRQMAARKMDAFFWAKEPKGALVPAFDPATAAHVLALKLLASDALPALRYLFRDAPQAGSGIPHTKLRADTLELWREDVARLVNEGLVERTPEWWLLTEQGEKALQLWALVDADASAEEIAALVCPNLAEQAQARLDDILDRAAEVQQRLGEVEAYELLEAGKGRAPW